MYLKHDEKMAAKNITWNLCRCFQKPQPSIGPTHHAMTLHKWEVQRNQRLASEGIEGNKASMASIVVTPGGSLVTANAPCKMYRTGPL